MYNPPHPGQLIKKILGDSHSSIAKAAHKIGMKRQALSRIIHGKQRITAPIAILLGKLFGVTPLSWLTQQIHYDLWQEGINVWELENKADKNDTEKPW